jgi:hypothetical protein
MFGNIYTTTHTLAMFRKTLTLAGLLAAAIGCAAGEGPHVPPQQTGLAGAGMGGTQDATGGGGTGGTAGPAMDQDAGAGTGGSVPEPDADPTGLAGASPDGAAAGAAGAAGSPVDAAVPDTMAAAGTNGTKPADGGAAETASTTPGLFYEAEDGRISGNGRRVTCTGCSGGRRVVLGADALLTISNVEVKNAGTHVLVVRYTNGDTQDRSIYVGINGSDSQAFWWTFKPTGGWDKVSSMALTLAGWRAGANNTVNLFIDTELDPPDIDRIEMLPDPTVGGTNYCDRSHWEATASVTAGDGSGPKGAIDGDLKTRWANNHEQNGSDWYQLDFGGLVKLSSITLDNTQAYPNDYPGKYAVYGSVDGLSFDSAPFDTGDGTPNKTIMQFKERSVRAVKILEVGSARSPHWWQIGELQVGCRM